MMPRIDHVRPPFSNTPLTRMQPVSARMTQPVLRPVIFSWKNIAARNSTKTGHMARRTAASARELLETAIL